MLAHAISIDLSKVRLFFSKIVQTISKDKSLMGLAYYFMRFIKGFYKIKSPLI